MRRLIGIHAVAAALRSARETGGGIDRVIVAQDARNSRLEALVAECRSLGIPILFEPRAAMRRLAGSHSHQNIVAFSSAGPYQSLDTVLDTADDECTLIVLDSVQDPHNLGAVVRTAEGAGAAAVVIPERRSAGLDEAASKAAAGALETLPVARVKNLGRTLDALKEADFWLYGFDAAGDTPYDRIEYTRRCALVLGGESRGLHAKVLERCDHLVRIPLAGRVSSLNVSVVAGIALFEVCRQRRMRSAPRNPSAKWNQPGASGRSSL